jgi:hypothetical protein
MILFKIAFFYYEIALSNALKLEWSKITLNVFCMQPINGVIKAMIFCSKSLKIKG